MTKHQLIGNGAAFDLDGERISAEGSTKGTGAAMCHCGWLSDELETGAARRQAFKSHKQDVDFSEMLLEFGAVELPEAEEEAEDTISDDEAEQLAKEWADLDEDAILDEDAPIEATAVAHFSGPAKHFFPFFGRDGGKDFAMSHQGVTSVDHDSKEFTLTIHGPEQAVVDNVARSLETLWSDGYDDFKIWKKTDEKYTSTPRSEKWGRDARFEMEQEWFRAYCANAACELSATV